VSAAQGRYCLDITAPTTPRTVAATITWSGETATAGQGITATVEPEGVSAACPASPSSDAFVETEEGPLESSAPDAKPFYVVFN
jgi:hypothetical protein